MIIVKGLTNEVTLLPTQMFPRLPARATFLADTYFVSETKTVSDFVQKHFVSATNVSQFTQPKKHHEQQCVRNNVSSFARVLNCKCNCRFIYPQSTKELKEAMHSRIE